MRCHDSGASNTHSLVTRHEVAAEQVRPESTKMCKLYGSSRMRLLKSVRSVMALPPNEGLHYSGLKTLEVWLCQEQPPCHLNGKSVCLVTGVAPDPFSTSTWTPSCIREKCLGFWLSPPCPQRGLQAIHNHPGILGNFGQGRSSNICDSVG